MTALRLVNVLIALLCAMFLWRVSATIALHVPFDPNEGWNAYHAAAAIAGNPLYPGADSFMVNNYPPLSFYIVGTLGRLLGDNIIAGRIISLLAFFGIAFGIFVAARVMRCSRPEAIFSALLFAICLLVTSDYVGMDDPQLLGHAIGIAGFILLLREPRDWRAVAASALLFALAGFVKHNLVVQPLATVLWLFIFDRSAASRFIVAGIAFLLIGLLAFRSAYGIDLLTVLNSARIYSFHNFTFNLANWLVWGTIPILGMLLLLLQRCRDKYVILCVLYAFIAVVVGAIFFGGDGVDVNAMFDADIALALGAGLALNRLPARNILAFVYVVPVALVLWQFRDSQWLKRDFWLHPLQTEAEATNRDIAFLRKQTGPALCEMLSLCYWASKQAEVDVFNIGEQLATGARSDKALTELVEQRYFRTLQFESLSPFALTPRIREAVMRNYRIDHTNDNGVFLIPR